MRAQAILISLLLAIPAYADEKTAWETKGTTFVTTLQICGADDCSPLASISVKGDSTFTWDTIERKAAKYVPGAANDQWIAIAKLLWDSRQQALAEAKTAK